MQQLVVLLVVTHAVRVVFGLQLASLDLLLLQQQLALVISVHHKRLNLALQLLLQSLQLIDLLLRQQVQLIFYFFVLKAVPPRLLKSHHFF